MVLEYVLLALCLCVIALRATITEAPGAQSAAQPLNLGQNVYSLSLSAVLIISFIAWFIWSFCSRRFLYRFTTIEIGLCLFAAAAVIATFTAANNRAAITGSVTLLAPILMAVLLVQILDSHSKIKLTLACIAALGVVSAYESANQLFFTNQAMIDEYEKAPQSLLQPLGITTDTLDHFQFEHRLYSKDVKAFFTTGNSAGAFAIFAAFAGLALFIDKLKNRKSCATTPLYLLTCGTAVAVIIFGLVITKSKGAIAASLIAAAMFLIYLLFGNWLKAHRKTILILCLLLGLAGGYVVVSYGLTHGRLPGGNSMLVRWQYWQASARMYADHPFTGVGPGNFANFYPHYKVPAALETIADPHNFLLSILTQYGPLGLVGFLALVFIPLWKASSGRASSSQKAHQPEPKFKLLTVTILIVISAALLLIRPMVLKMSHSTDSLEVIIYVIFTLYVMPVVAFIVGFWLLTAPLHTTPGTQHTAPRANITIAALVCAGLGCLIHNLIDFAIFEPGVFTTFCAIIACLVALDSHRKSRPQLILKPALFAKVLMLVVTLLLIWAFFYYALIPTAKATAKIKQARQAASIGRFQSAHNLLTAAAEDDRLSPTALSLNARLYLQRFLFSVSKQKALLLQAEKCLLNAIQRNKAAFKNFERLTDVYSLLAETSTEQRTDCLNKAFENARLAVERYPGSGRLRIKLAQIAEQLGKTNAAIEHYRKAIDIEDSFRRQFQQIYPDRQVLTRLGEDKYHAAKQRIKYLTGQPTP